MYEVYALMFAYMAFDLSIIGLHHKTGDLRYMIVSYASEVFALVAMYVYLEMYEADWIYSFIMGAMVVYGLLRLRQNYKKYRAQRRQIDVEEPLKEV
jgi:hypothetical protein